MRVHVLSLSAALLAVPGVSLAASGPELYATNCAMCHQANGEGAPGQFPPLKGRVDRIAQSGEGRHYLADLLTHGMTGHIRAAGATYVGYMPSFAQLPDGDIAQILNWLASLGGTPPPAIAAADIAQARSRSLSPADLAKERGALDAAHPLP